MENLQGSTTDLGAQNPQGNVQSGLQPGTQNVQNSVVNQSSLLAPSTTLHVETCAQNCALGVTTAAPQTNNSLSAGYLGLGLLVVAFAAVGIFAARVLKS